jgi:AcrR family transcriptional regulator
MDSTTKPRKLQIEEVATELFREKGFSGTSVRDVAAAVGIEAASLYSHVSGKEELLQAICFRMAHKFLDSLNLVIADPTRDPVTKLGSAIKKHVLIITRNLSSAAVFWNEWRYMSEPFFADFEKMQREYEHKFRHIIQEGVEQGAFKVTNLTFSTMAILSALNGIHKWHDYTLPPEDLAEAFAELFINGLRN